MWKWLYHNPIWQGWMNGLIFIPSDECKQYMVICLTHLMTVVNLVEGFLAQSTIQRHPINIRFRGFLWSIVCCSMVQPQNRCFHDHVNDAYQLRGYEKYGKNDTQFWTIQKDQKKWYSLLLPYGKSLVMIISERHESVDTF